METEIFMDRQFHPESEVLSEHQKDIFLKNNYVRNEMDCLKKEISVDTSAVVTPNDPLNIDCESPVDVLGENLVNINNNVQQGNSLLQMSIIKAETRTISTQTNTRLCGTVQVSEFAEDYRFNCFYCCQTFPLEKWMKFIAHLKKKHFDYEEAFEICKYVSGDHDYTPINAKSSTIVETAPVMKSSQLKTLLIDPKSILPHLADPLETSYDLAIDSLDRNLYYTEENNLALANNTDILNSSVKSTISSFVVERTIGKENIFNVSTNNGKEGIATPSLTMGSKNEKKKLIKKRAVKKSSKNTFGNTGKSMQKDLSSEVLYLKNLRNIKRKTSNKTALSRCLKRSNTIETLDAEEIGDECNFSTVESFQQKTTELTFEYTPRDIIDFLLDNIKNYAVLWQFDETPFNEDFYEAIEELCRINNEKWSLNIDTLKMRRSVNRVLRFYCSLYPYGNLENINQFTCYYDKCAVFLPASVHEIAYARCSHCYKCYKNDSELKAHLLDEQRYLQWPYKCVECKECFRDNDEYEFHKRLPHYQEVFRCQLCNKRFTRRNKYNRHILTHQLKQSDEPGKHVCNVCGKAFKLSGELRGHIIFHGEKKHTCHLCPKKYFTKALLEKHIDAHNKKYRLVCEVCGKGFIDHKNMREHMNKHTGAKVTCNICNLKLRKSSLMRHLRTVHVPCEGTIETTYRARNHHYMSLFMQPSRRAYIKRTKYKNYSCKICNIQFDGCKFLITHNKEFHSDTPKWSCKLCSSELKSKLSIKRHYRIKHNLHAYQVYKLIEKNEDIDTVLAIKKEELDKLCETLGYSLASGSASAPSSSNSPFHTTIVKSDPSADEIYIEEERLNSDTIQDEIMKVADNINTSEHEIKIDDDFFTNLLK